jgi:hypothetical protein
MVVAPRLSWRLMFSIAFAGSGLIAGVFTESGYRHRTSAVVAAARPFTSSLKLPIAGSRPRSMLPSNTKSLFSYAIASFASSAGVFGAGAWGGGVAGVVAPAAPPRLPRPRGFAGA